MKTVQLIIPPNKGDILREITVVRHDGGRFHGFLKAVFPDLIRRKTVDYLIQVRSMRFPNERDAFIRLSDVAYYDFGRRTYSIERTCHD